MIKTALLALIGTALTACAGPGYAYYETPAYGYAPAAARVHRPIYVPQQNQNYYFSPCSPRPFTPPNPWIPGGAGGSGSPIYRTYSGPRVVASWN